MYIKNLKKFIWIDFNPSKKDFLEVLRISNIYNFDAYKLEKDFLLTVILIYLWKEYKDLIFKWGTCLNKIYLDYFRLSEDLDFVLIESWSRKQRKSTLEQYKQKLSNDLATLWLQITDNRTKYNEDRQGIFNFSYSSIIDNSLQNIQIDITLKEDLELAPVDQNINSIFVDKIMEENIFTNHTIRCMHFDEIVAEKIRASLTRSQPAIRDFFDVWYIKTFAKFDFWNIQDLLNTKLNEVQYKYTIDGSFDSLEKQITIDLNPVLKKDFDFNLNEVFHEIMKLKPI